ncbi:hypothetical protein MAE02_61520 [Microvirga aerophila]|uniref:DNA-binding protein n=1 Tax=Microvirga aerophila TaxID=670291 RepID=A0A512C2L9_9HYPH|nr:hypothetical protein MAE02_61520 [Microvirga aerophila]
MPSSITRLLSRHDAAVLLRDRFNLPCSPQTLARWACEGNGPPFHKVCGRALYPEASLIAWAQDLLGPLEPRPLEPTTSAQSGLPSNA